MTSCVLNQIFFVTVLIVKDPSETAEHQTVLSESCS